MIKKEVIIVQISLFMIIFFFGCIHQNGDVYMSAEIQIKTTSEDLFCTNEFLYVAASKIVCYNWEGDIIWETPILGSTRIVDIKGGIFIQTYDIDREIFGIALLNLKGEIIWEKEMDQISSLGIGASDNLLAVGSSKTGTLYAYSPEGELLWKYHHFTGIDQVMVAPDSSHIVFTGYDDTVNCVKDSNLVWSRDVGEVDTGWSRRTMAFAPDSSYLVYESRKGGDSICASTPDGKVLWSYPIEKYIKSVAISEDGQSIFVGGFEYVYKLTPQGTCVWSTWVGGNIHYIASTPGAEYIAVISNGLPATLEVLNKEGEVLWSARSWDTIFSVAISPDGNHVAFGNRLHQLHIFSNPPRELQ